MITISEMKLLDNAGNLKATFNLNISDRIEIDGCKIVQQPGQAAWAAMPSVKNGDYWQHPIRITSKELQSKISEEAIAAYEVLKKEKQITSPSEGDPGNDADLPF